MQQERELSRLLASLTPEEKAELDTLLAEDVSAVPWRPLPGPQTFAYDSPADVIGFGGAAGGGKSDLALGLALTKHTQTQIFRREGPQLKGLLDRLKSIVPEDRITGNPPVYRHNGKQIEFNSTPNLGDERKYQGRPKDLLVIDEASNFLESQVRFIKGWVRTTLPDQKCTTLMTFNPPTSTEGRWIVSFFGPWIDRTHPLYPTPPGELRYAYTNPITRKDVWVDSPDSFILNPDGTPDYGYDPLDPTITPEQLITPESRTFIPSRITDNPFLVSTGYLTTLQSMPEPLRSQMLLGDFEAGIEDDPWQVIPTEWVDQAMARWKKKDRKEEMLSLGVDVARGGRDFTAIARRHVDYWFDEPILLPGKATPDGPTVAGQVIAAMRDKAPIHIDVVGVGASPYDVLRSSNQPVFGIQASGRATSFDKTGRLKFINLRAQMWWKMREALDPSSNTGIQLPPNAQLRKELITPRWEMIASGIKVESREDIVSRIGSSPDIATAYCLAMFDTPKLHLLQGSSADAPFDYNPYERTNA